MKAKGKKNIPLLSWGFVGIFAVIFVLTQDYLWGGWDSEGSWWGFPGWLPWFMGVHLLFLVALWAYNRYSSDQY
ncbi:MAG: hypothetical protein AAFR61_31195 [Bacteroidota bacterium]